MSRNTLITGRNSGIGLEMALALVGQGDRRPQRSEVTHRTGAHLYSTPEARAESMQLDLADFDQIDRFSAELLERRPIIDVLILNAGLYTLKIRRLANSYETMMGIMHFGHFLLVQNLLEAVKAALRARIVVTCSMMHKFGKINPAALRNLPATAIP